LWVTVFEEDDEAAAIWLDEIGVDPARFSRIGAQDNFWAMGDIGPCGPCSEIFFDHGPTIAGGPPGTPEAEGDRYVEIWNLVFMQFNRDTQGDLHPLPRPSVDTGMGLERMAAVLQGVHDNFDTDCFAPLIAAVRELHGHGAGDHSARVSERVIADHLRAVTFLTGDGVLPANDGRGYVLRRILRRAARHGKMLGLDRPFLCDLVPALVGQMKDAYPELIARQEAIVRLVRGEEERFHTTLDYGLRLLEESIAQVRAAGGNELPGEDLFRLYDTYGFPVDLTRDICRDAGLTVDEAGCVAAMEAQRSRARASWKGGAAVEAAEVYRRLVDEVGETVFTGYDGIEGRAHLLAILQDGKRVERAATGAAVELIFDRTPFYAESGGQVGDRGEIVAPGVEVRIGDTVAPVPGVRLHKGEVVSGAIQVGEAYELFVDGSARAATARNHTGTHLLHAALREVLGDHVKQAGSLVAPDRLRFDIHHFAPIEPPQLRMVEELVNQEIWRHSDVATRVQGLEDAIAGGAMALFGEKYGDRVRVVSVGGFSTELCGGTHVANAADIGLLVIEKEAGIAAGVRRIEAHTGPAALAYLHRQGERLAEAAAVIKAKPEELAERLARQVARERELSREIDGLRRRLADLEAAAQSDAAEEIGGVRLLVRDVGDGDAATLRDLADSLRAQGTPFVALFAARQQDKPLLLCAVERDLSKRIKAGDVIKAISSHIQGGGGGKPDLAQAGGKEVAGIAAALDAGRTLLRAQLAE
jgi:alanyl-tRNA synthetase